MINNVSMVSDDKHQEVNVLNKTTLKSFCWALSSVHSQEVDTCCSANSGTEEGYQQVLCHGDFEELSVERGKCWPWQETLKSAKLCQRGSQDYTLPPKPFRHCIPSCAYVNLDKRWGVYKTTTVCPDRRSCFCACLHQSCSASQGTGLYQR